MLAVSLVVLAVAYLNPPQIFLIMYFGGTVIAGAWSLVAFGSVWSRRLSRCGAYLGMLLGFLGCVGAKAIYALRGITPAGLGGRVFHRHRPEPARRGARLCAAAGDAGRSSLRVRGSLTRPPGANEAAACKADRRLWRVYLVFGICVGLFFLLFYAIPYSHAL